MNFAQYKNTIISYLPASKIRPDPEFLYALNSARKEICHLFDPIIDYFSFNTTLNQQEYDLNALLGTFYFSSVSKILNATCKYDQYNYPLRKIFKEEIVFTSFAGIPFFYYFYNNIFGLYPIPAQIYTVTIKFSKLVADLTADGTENEKLLPFTDLIIFLACERISMFLGNAELAIYFRRLFDDKRINIRTQYR